MPSGTSETAAQASPSISADFLTGSTEVGLDRIRTRLLDLTNRNKLLNYRHTAASSLWVVEASIDAVFQSLRDGNKLAFMPVPEPEFEGSAAPTAKDYAAELGWETSFDLDTVDDTPPEGLAVLHYHEDLDRLSRKITGAAKTAIEESGANMLHLVFGFLEWYESGDSSQPHLAPLVVSPMAIERVGGKGRAVDTVIEYSGEDVETNLSLVEKMRREFGLEIPLLADDDTPESYFEKFSDILKLKKTWRIRRHITLALLSFGKLLMYRDLDPRTWPTDQSIAKHALVRELFEGSKNPVGDPAEEYPIDAPDLVKDVPQLIRDADSSQHSALVHALRGQNLVIEGPPGTGKSQTITNLIAAALARGKTVLFVAEKLAALEVVRRRLDDAGLGIFCLELHSHKTKKGALINDIGQRCAARGTFKEPRELDLHLSTAEEKKRLLTQYASLINQTVEPFGATVFEILWALDRRGQDVPEFRDRLTQVILPIVVKYSRPQFSQTEQFLSVYGRHLSAVLDSAGSLREHPWAWITKPLLFEEEERILTLLAEFLSTLEQVTEHCTHLLSDARIALTQNHSELETAMHTLAPLPESGGALIQDLMAPCQSPETRESLLEFIREVESFRRSFTKVAACAGSATPLLDVMTANELARALDCFNRWGLDGYSIAQIRDLVLTTAGTARLLSEAQSSFRVLLTAIGCDAPVSLTSSTFLLETARIIEAAPFERLHLRLPSFEHERAQPTLNAASKEAQELNATESSLSAEFDLTFVGSAVTPNQLLEHAAVLDQASLWQRFFGGGYRDAVRAYRRIARHRKKISRREMSTSLRTLGEFTGRRGRFEANPAYRDLLGSHFQGVATPWEDLHAVLLWYEQIFVALPEHQTQSEPFRRLVFTARAEHLKSIKATLGPAQEHRQALEQIVTRVGDFTRKVPNQRALMISGSFEDILSSLQMFTHEIGDALKAVDAASISDDLCLADVSGAIAAAQCRTAIANVQSNPGLAALIGPSFRGVNTDIEPIRHTVKFAETIASGSLPQQTVTWLLCPEYGARLTDLRTWLTGAAECATKLTAQGEELASLSGSASWRNVAGGSWGGLQALAAYALAKSNDLPEWNHFLRVQIESREKGLSRLTAMAEDRTLEPRQLPAAFHYVFYNTLARSVFTEHADLSQVTGVTQEELRHQFAQADREAIRLYSERVAALIDLRYVPPGNPSGKVSEKTEMSLLIHETAKQKKHIPIRQLLRRSANALVALKPCFMMGPLSVAQYLAPGQLKFDFVVMDEASQLKPEDAIGALARGGQVVIVGDPKQLPPTNFFDRVSLDTDDEVSDETRTAGVLRAVGAATGGNGAGFAE